MIRILLVVAAMAVIVAVDVLFFRHRAGRRRLLLEISEVNGIIISGLGGC